MAKTLPERLDRNRFDAITQHIRSLDYRKRRNFLWHEVSPRLSRFLYKFRVLAPSDRTSVDRIRDIVVRSRFWLSSAVDFNDPFDMSAKLIAQGTLKEKRKRFRDLLKQRPLSWKERQHLLSRIMLKTDAEVTDVAQAAHRRNVELGGICSFAGDPRSILMWSHYAANHEGLCFQFEVARDVSTFVQAVDVEYKDEYPVVNWMTDFDAGVRTTIRRKHSGWIYEKESRIVIPELAHTYLSFQPEALRGIIIGCRAKETTVDKMMELLDERFAAGKPTLTLYKAVQHDSKYRLVIKRYQSTTAHK